MMQPVNMVSENGLCKWVQPFPGAGFRYSENSKNLAGIKAFVGKINACAGKIAPPSGRSKHMPGIAGKPGNRAFYLYIMQSDGHMQTTNSEVFLLGAFINIIANIDYPALADYAMRAAIGGLIYFLFKVIADYISDRFFSTDKRKKRTR